MDVVVEWVDAGDRLPRDGMPVAAATTGRYPAYTEAEPDDEHSGQDFWLVMPMRFSKRHIGEDGYEYHDCFIDSDGLIRLPLGRPCPEPITHWAYLPALPGTSVRFLVGQGVRTALHDARGGPSIL